MLECWQEDRSRGTRDKFGNKRIENRYFDADGTFEMVFKQVRQSKLRVDVKSAFTQSVAHRDWTMFPEPRNRRQVAPRSWMFLE